jgi:RNA:NAD 2'-phosphotransferase (TPT1/KptA family)
MEHSYEYGVDVSVPNWRTLRDCPINKPLESFEFSKLIIKFLRHHTVKRHRYSNPRLRFRINDYGYAFLEDLLVYVNDNRASIRRRITGSDHPSLVVLSLRDLLAILRTEKPRYIVIGKRSRVDESTFVIVPWMVRAIEGHSSAMPYLANIATPITEEHTDWITAICHGTRLANLPSILRCGLNPMQRQSVMFAPFPHWDPRLGPGQRSGADDWDVIVFLRVNLSVMGDLTLTPPVPKLPLSLLGETGTINVPTVVSPVYFEKVVSKIAVTNLDRQFEGAHVPRGGDVTAPSSDAGHLDFGLAEGYQSECFHLSPQNNVIVIFHHEFRNKKIYGYVGGRDRTQIRRCRW